MAKQLLTYFLFLIGCSQSTAFFRLLAYTFLFSPFQSNGVISALLVKNTFVFSLCYCISCLQVGSPRLIINSCLRLGKLSNAFCSSIRSSGGITVIGELVSIRNSFVFVHFDWRRFKFLLFSNVFLLSDEFFHLFDYLIHSVRLFLPVSLLTVRLLIIRCLNNGPFFRSC